MFSRIYPVLNQLETRLDTMRIRKRYHVQAKWICDTGFKLHAFSSPGRWSVVSARKMRVQRGVPAGSQQRSRKAVHDLHKGIFENSSCAVFQSKIENTLYNLTFEMSLLNRYSPIAYGRSHASYYQYLHEVFIWVIDSILNIISGFIYHSCVGIACLEKS